jgi:hypothetical protein
MYVWELWNSKTVEFLGIYLFLVPCICLSIVRLQSSMLYNGRLIHKWDSNAGIKIYLNEIEYEGLGWLYLAQDRVQR